MMSDEEAKINRREFVKFSAMSSVAVGGLYTLAAKTDILGQEPKQSSINVGEDSNGSSYGYSGGAP